MYPIMIDLTDKAIIVIGGGTIALRKVKRLIASGGRPTVVAPKLNDAFLEMEGIKVIKASYQKEQIEEANLIFACTDSKAVNQQIVDDAQSWQWVNDCSRQTNSDFFNMATVENQEFLIALSSFGKSPAAVKQMKEQLEVFLSYKEEYD